MRKWSTGYSRAADVAWNAFQAVNRRVPARAFQPAWSPEPFRDPRAHEASPRLPRRTDSLCPTCTREVRTPRAARASCATSRRAARGIAADIVLRGNEIWMVKTARSTARSRT